MSTTGRTVHHPGHSKVAFRRPISSRTSRRNLLRRTMAPLRVRSTRRFEFLDLETLPRCPFGLKRAAYLVQLRPLFVQLRAKFVDLAQALFDPVEQSRLVGTLHIGDRGAPPPARNPAVAPVESAATVPPPPHRRSGSRSGLGLPAAAARSVHRSGSRTQSSLYAPPVLRSSSRLTLKST
jgi:hypothetical protein